MLELGEKAALPSNSPSEEKIRTVSPGDWGGLILSTAPEKIHGWRCKIDFSLPFFKYSEGVVCEAGGVFLMNGLLSVIN